ncbi:MATE family efflux transporter [Geobacter sp.]|uniref:MATE family efflux transporter n=1 Tax=Geobacter sp. TaxID=46610 RepID=UPI0026270E70|nr:MATE family efflux transporter [Geobacter sp.]
MNKIPPHLLVAASGWASRFIVAATGLFTIRLLTQSLGSERYAVYSILGGLQGWFLLIDFGIGVSLQNHISERRARKEPYGEFISEAALLGAVLLAASTVLLYFIAPHFGSALLKEFPFLSPGEKRTDFFIVGLSAMTMAVGSMVYKIWYAEQKGYLANLVPAVASAISLLAVFLVSRSALVDKLFWSLVASFVPLAVFPVLGLVGKMAKCPKNCRALDPAVLGPLLKRALKFWGFAIMACGVLQIDYLIMSQFLKAPEIVVYNLASKVFNLVFFVYNAVLAAIWPICAEAVATSSWHVVQRYTRKYLVVGGGLIAFATVVFAISMPQLVRLLSPKEPVVVPVLFILLLGFYQMVRVWTDTFAMVLQSMSYLRPFWMFVPMQALLSAGLQLALVPSYGIYGVVVGLIGSFLLTVSWLLPLALQRHIKNVRRQQNI